MSFSFKTASRSDTGHVRSRNEDNHYTDPANGLWLVADGMGGHDAGDLASQAIVDAMATVGRPTSANDLLNRVQDRLIIAHQRIKVIARDRGVSIIGATVTALLTFDRYFAAVWSGDSRIYRIAGGDGVIHQVTRDHNEVEEMIAQGILTPEEGRRWPGRNAITRAVGVHDDLELEIVHGEIAPDDVFVLCSDGLTLYARDDEIRTIASQEDPERAAAELIDLAMVRGGEDNITVVIVKCEAAHDEALTTIMPARRASR